LLGLGLRAKSHHALDAGAVVPAAIKQHDLARGGQIGNVALEIPGAPVALARRPERDYAGFARTQMLDDAFDRPILASGIASFENHEDALAARDHMPLQLHQLDLELQERVIISLM